MEKGESVTLELQSNVEQGQKKKIKKLQKFVDANDEKKKALIDLYLEGLIEKENLKGKEEILKCKL